MATSDFSVSVIIPVFNADKYLAASVASALKISEVKEIILIEDGSSDASLNECIRLSRADVRVKFYQHENGVNKGAGESRNLGIKKATCPYVAFLDSDDYYFENRYVSARQLLNNNLSVDGVYEFVLKINEATREEKLFGIQKQTGSKDLFRYILRGGYFHTNAITVRRDFLMKVGLFQQHCWPHEDVEMWLRMAFLGTLVPGTKSDPVATYRIHGVNVGTSAFSTRSRAHLWRTIFLEYFYKDIGFINRLIILKQIVRFTFARFKDRRNVSMK